MSTRQRIYLFGKHQPRTNQFSSSSKYFQNFLSKAYHVRHFEFLSALKRASRHRCRSPTKCAKLFHDNTKNLSIFLNPPARWFWYRHTLEKNILKKNRFFFACPRPTSRWRYPVYYTLVSPFHMCWAAAVCRHRHDHTTACALFAIAS